MYEKDHYTMINVNKVLPIRWMSIEAIQFSVFTTQSDVVGHAVMVALLQIFITLIFFLNKNKILFTKSVPINSNLAKSLEMIFKLKRMMKYSCHIYIKNNLLLAILKSLTFY